MVETKELTKIKDLTPQHSRVNVLARVVKLGEVREVPSRYGPPRKVSDTVIGDETGTIVMSLWQEQVGTVKEGDVIYIDNGYISLFRGHMRLNIGKYGTLSKSDQPMEVVSTELDMSEKEWPMERRRERFEDREGGWGRGPREDERRKPRF
ncbi:MAG: single-stranded DNA-binding protein [Thermoplasmata archaeon]